jgi:hypothetical protein
MQICEKHQITNFFEESKINREKYFKEGYFFEIF